MLEIYTDGACRGNQNTFNKGGWGFVLTDTVSGKTRHRWGHEPNTTNNRMEMTAVIKALHDIRNRDRSPVTIYSDSNLIIKGMTEWISGWKAKDWKNSSKKPVENKDLWVQIDELSSKHNVNWRHVKGHNGNPGNEMADTLANLGADGKTGKRDINADNN